MNNQQNEFMLLKEEIEEVQARLNRIESFLSSFEASPESSSILDDRFNEALELIKDQEKITASELQRRLRIGFTKAARIIDQLESVGLVSPPGYPISKARDIYHDKIKAYIETIKTT